jgi:hypothetical protein
MTRLLDTDTCIGVLRQRPGMAQRLSQLAPTDCAVSMVTVYELFCGVENQRGPRIRCRTKLLVRVSLTFDGLKPLLRSAGSTLLNCNASMGTTQSSRVFRWGCRGKTGR